MARLETSVVVGSADITDASITVDDIAASAKDAAAGTASLRTLGTSSTSACAGNDSRLSDSRAPTAHNTSHQSGGSDAVKLDDLSAPDDNTDLDVSTSAHGLVPKAPNDTTKFLRGDATWAATGAPAASVYTAAKWYGGPGFHYDTGSFSNQRVIYIPFFVGVAHTFTGLGIDVATAGESGAKIRLGVYSDSSGQPGTLVVDGGQVAADTTGAKTTTGLTIALTPGLVWLAYCTQAAATTQPVVRRYLFAWPIIGMDSVDSNPTLFYEDSVSGALPATATPAIGQFNAPSVAILA